MKKNTFAGVNASRPLTLNTKDSFIRVFLSSLNDDDRLKFKRILFSFNKRLKFKYELIYNNKYSLLYPLLYYFCIDSFVDNYNINSFDLIILLSIFFLQGEYSNIERDKLLDFLKFINHSTCKIEYKRYYRLVKQGYVKSINLRAAHSPRLSITLKGIDVINNLNMYITNFINEVSNKLI